MSHGKKTKSVCEDSDARGVSCRPGESIMRGYVDGESWARNIIREWQPAAEPRRLRRRLLMADRVRTNQEAI
jgi:hypothetical protein